ncbi:MAG: hypothetical protein IKO65_02915 [Victivallales bacterium]|jgi:acyl carrier protein|nr:hypothetical protein [Victivallales bacterium]
MTREEIIQQVNTVFVDQFEIEAERLTPEKQLFTDLGLDSLDIVDLLVELHKSFGIALRNNEEVRKVRTLGDVYDFLEKYAREHPEEIHSAGN